MHGGAPRGTTEPASAFSTYDVPLFTARRKSHRRSGWYVGIVLGVLAGLLALPPVRYTLSSQLAFAFAEDSIPWMQALDTRRAARETTRLDTTAAGVPGDYLIQIGRATAQADEADKPVASREKSADENTLFRLAGVVRDFPSVPGAYAHLARYMMSARIRIRRGEIDSRYALTSLPDPTVTKDESSAASPRRQAGLLPLYGDSPRARRRNIQLMEWALRAGEARDPDNAFWPAMLATAYFSAQRDREALAALQRASRKSEWNAYIHEEVLGQWRLYSAAYGDNGAAQKIAPLSLIAFPHLLEIRHAAEMARWKADCAAEAGHVEEAVRIRRSVAWLGIRMRDTAQWSLEALCGADIVLIISSDSGRESRPIAIQSRKDWEKQAAHYLALLQKKRMQHEIAWLGDEVETSCGLRAQVDIARYDASYPGIPPGIPLVPLFGDWIIGVCLLQQMLGLGSAALIAALCRSRLSALPRSIRLLFPFAAVCGAAVCGSLLLTGIPTTRIAGGFVLCLTALGLFLMEAISQALNRGNRKENREEKKSDCDALSSLNSTFNIQNRSSLCLPDSEARAESHWRAATTGYLLVFLLPPGMALLYYLRPELSFLHPVATLLMSVMGAGRIATIGDAMGLALMACGLPVAFILLMGLWSLGHRLSPLAGVAVGLRRSTLPALACLALIYLGILDRTLELDAAASRGINEVAQNDLQWVLTHSSPPASEEE